MKFKLVLPGIIFLSILCFSGSAFAAWSFNIDTDYVQGDATAEFSLYLTTDEPLSVDSYYLEFIYDENELSYTGSTNTPIAGLTPMFGGVTGSEGAVDNFHASILWGADPVDITSGNYLLGTFSFDVIGAIEDGTTDFNFDYSDLMNVIRINGSQTISETLMPSNFTDISPSSVPIPGAGLLLGAGLIGLVGISRRKF